jgi:hypothetical protein
MELEFAGLRAFMQTCAMEARKETRESPLGTRADAELDAGA